MGSLYMVQWMDSVRMLWLEVAQTNNDPRVPAAFFLKQVHEVGGCPLLLVTDCGSENCIPASMQCVFRSNLQDDQADSKSHRYCSSPANQQIEGCWSFFRRTRSNWWINLFKDLVNYGLLCAENILHMECLWFCFSKLLQEDLNKVKDHKISSLHTVLFMGYQMLCTFYQNIMDMKNV